MAKIERVGHVVLNVSDTQASAQWYVDVLGMELMNYTPAWKWPSYPSAHRTTI